MTLITYQTWYKSVQPVPLVATVRLHVLQEQFDDTKIVILKQKLKIIEIDQ